ncbi:response regulator transcription factor [Aridibaculum aurantiacum]|uniref:response regulator transcription factor n=1 Tax=Aridibaculum aurantiacum TaxID=2810307 RepID=UPI001A970924|nr:response regulator transcription factor [Aridibaculum aurantiacum]
MNKDKIVLVDDHVLLRCGLATLVINLGYEIMYECSNGKELTEKVDKHNAPDLVLMDINMPVMDGYETTTWLSKNYPLVNVLALSMYDDENAIIRMIRNGAKGYILKDCSPQELGKAINAVLTNGFHYSEKVTGKVIHSIREMDKDDSTTKQVLNLNEKEIEFLKYAATEMTYKEIALQMHLSPRTIDGYRDQLFEKLKLKSRVGLVLFAIKQGIIQIT